MRTRKLILLILISLTAGCSGQKRVQAPAWNPSAAAAHAMELWDENQDGLLGGDELRQCPGLARDRLAIDSNGDKSISSEELQARLTAFEEMRVGLKVASFRVTLDGRPLPDAKVTLVPEEFLGAVLEPAEGTTDAAGMVTPQAEQAKPLDLEAMQLGYYRVEIESPRISTDAQRESVRSLGASVDPFSYAQQTLAIE